MAIDWRASSVALVAGQPGSGKSVATSALIAGALASGAELAIVDDPAKKVDYLWCKPFVAKIGHHVLCGTNPSKTARTQAADVARYAPSLDDGDDGDGAPGRHVSPEVVAADDWDVDPETGERLTGQCDRLV